MSYPVMFGDLIYTVHKSYYSMLRTQSKDAHLWSGCVYLFVSLGWDLVCQSSLTYILTLTIAAND